SDFAPVFTSGRKMLTDLTGQQSINSQERFNIQIIQYLLSNIALYEDFIDVIPEEFRGSAHDIRSQVFMDNWEATMKNNKTVYTLIKPSLASILEKLKDEADPESGISYGNLYPAISYFLTSVKNSNAAPSWVKTDNTSTFKETVSSEIPYSIELM